MFLTVFYMFITYMLYLYVLNIFETCLTHEAYVKS